MPNNSPAGRLGAVVELPSYLYAYLSASQDTYSHGYVVPVPAHVARSAIEVGLHAIHVEQPALSLSLSTQPAGASPEVERVAPVARLADIRLASGDDVEQVYTDWVYRPFDPGVEPLARYALIHGSDGQRWFAASFHHLVMDGTSIWLHGHHLVRRFFENRLIPTRSIPFPEWWAAVQQRDVDNRAAWRAHLGGSAESYVRIPKKTPMSEPTASPFIERHLDVTHLSQIRRFCRQHGITVPLYFMGLYGLVVNALYAVGASFVVRDVQANRDRATADMMGCFISNALYGFGCSDFTGTVVAYLQTLRDKRKNAGRCGPLHAWQVGDVVSENLVLSYNYIHFLEHMTSGEGEHDNYGLSSRHHNVVQLIVKNAGSHARLSLVHSAQVDMDSRFLERMLAVSDQLVGQSVVQVQDLAILLGGEDGAERRGEALSAYPDLNTQLLSCWRENASRPALWIEGEEYSYTAFYRRVFGIMARYEEAHLRASPVLILMNKSLDAYAAFIAALLSGNVAVPVNRDIPLERLQYILDDTRAAALVTDHDGDRYLSQEAVRTPIRLVLGGEQRECDIAPGQCRYDGGPAYVIYTSGSSGQPKGVRVSADALAQRAQAWQRCYGLNASDRILQLAEMGFDVFVGDLLRALTSGAALVVPTRGDIATPAHLATLIQNQRLTCAEFTPTTLAPLVTYLESEGKRLNLRVLVIGSENLPWPLVEAVQRICSGRLFNSYGTTESTIDNTFYGLPDSSSVMSQQQSNVPAGQPLAGVQVSVRNQQGHLLPVGVPGELYIGGGLADGYVGAAQDQNNRFVIVGTERHYRTGDLAIMDHGGVLSILGRLDGQLKINGIRLDPLEMQSALMASGAVRDAHVCQVERFGKAQLVAFVVPKKDMSTRLLKAWILQELARRFARALLPSRIVVLDQFPRNANGKVDARGMIAEHLQASSPPTERPLSDTEAAVADVYAAELGVYITDPSARFFDLGGHSLAAMRVVAALQRQGLSGVSASEMLENPSVSELARLINARRGDGQHVAALVSSPRMARYRCSREQERMWFLYRMNPASNAYSMPAAFHIRGEFDTEAFKASVNEVCRLHAQLHVRFFEDEGEVWQERDERRGPEYIELDFTHHRKAESDAYLKSEIARPFRLESEPLVRVYVLRTGRESALLMFNIHHIVSDGWSSNVFSQDVLLAYCQRSMGTRIALSKPEFEYFDYVAYQRSQQQCAALRRDLIYWKQKLAGLPERTPLRLTRAPLLESHHQICVRKRFEVPASLYASIKEFCRLRDVTEFVFLLAAYKAVLYRYTGQPDVCVGVPVARRDVMGTQNLVGFFVDAAVLRTQVDPRQSYSVLLDEVKATCQQASAHNTAQIADILEVLRLERARDERELLSAGFSFLKTAYAIEGELVPGVQIEEYGAAAQDAKFDLTLSMSSTEDDSETETMKAAIECRSRVGDLASLDWFWQAYVSELGALLADAPALQKVESHPQQAWVDLPCSDGVEALYPLNSTQLSMVMGAQLNPNSLDYSHGYKMLVDVDVDEQRWAAAIRRVTEQNPALRTRFAACRSPLSDEYVGIVMSAQDCAVHLQVERTHERPGAAVVDAQVADFIYQPYDVLSSHVVRHKLIKYATGGSLILFACHHALVDGLSLHRILTQVLDCYREGDAARPAAKPLVSSTARKPALCPDSSLAFWRDQGGRFASLDNVLLQAEQQPERRTIKQVYARDQRAQQRRICRSLGVSHAFYWQVVTMLATRQYYRGGDRQPIINIVSGRNKENASDVGCYIEKQYFFLPVEWLTSSINLATLFEKAKRQYRDIKGHYGISWAEFSRVMSERASDLSFNYQHFLDPIDLYGKQYHLSGCPCWSEKVIQVIARDHQDFFEIACLSGSNQKFDERILDRMVSINAQICESVERSVDQLVPWLPDEQRSVVVGKSLPQTMDRHHVFESWVQNNARLAPDQDALVDAHHRLTWREVEHLSASLALRIQVCVSSKLGATVAVAMEKSVLLYVALIAVQRSGCAYVPLDPGYPEERLTYMMEDSGARLLLTDKAKMSAMASEHAVQCIELETVQSMVSAALLPDGRLQLSDGKKGADRLAYIIYTSGTTGKPKGVCMGEAALAEKGIAWQQAYRLASSDVHLQMSNSAFDVCTGDVVRWLVSGSCLVACTYDELIDPAQLCQKMQDEGVTIAEFVPAVLRSVMDYLEEGNQRFPALRWIIVGSDKWYESDQERLNRLLPELTQCINSYGVTEVSIDSTYRKLLTSVSSDQATSSDGVMPIGQPFPGTTACVVDTAMQVLPRGFTGELCLAGGVAQGYHRLDAETARAFFWSDALGQRLYRTGDIARMALDGEIHLLGRENEQVKVRGHRVELAEIESQLCQVPGVKLGVVVVWRKAPADPGVLVAYLCPADSEGGTGEGDQVVDRARIALSSALPAYMQPAHYRLVDHLPLTPNGKVDRKLLSVPQDLDMAVISPRNKEEAQALAVWKSVLQVSQVCVTANFFESGGHSLMLVRVARGLTEQFGRTVPLSVVFEHQTIEQQVAWLQQAEDADDIERSLEQWRANEAGQIALEHQSWLLMPSQRRLWKLQQILPQDASLYIPAFFSLGRVIAEQELFELEEFMLSRFRILSGVIDGVDAPTLRLTRDVSRCVLLDSAELAQGAEALLRQYVHPSESLFYLVAIRDHHKGATTLGMLCHHVICDGVSMRTLGAALWQQVSQERPSILIDEMPAVDYLDYMNWFSRHVDELAQPGLAYWREYLKVDLPRPHDSSRRALVARVNHQSHVLPVPVNRITEFAAHHGVTPYAIFLVAYELLVELLDDAEELYVGVPVHGRHLSSLMDSVGLYADIAVTRVDRQSERSVLDRMKTKMDEATERSRFGWLPFDYVVEKLDLLALFGDYIGTKYGFGYADVTDVARPIPDVGLVQGAAGLAGLSEAASARAGVFDLKFDVVNQGLNFELEITLSDHGRHAGDSGKYAELFSNLVMAIVSSERRAVAETASAITNQALFPQGDRRLMSPRERALYWDSQVHSQAVFNRVGFALCLGRQSDSHLLGLTLIIGHELKACGVLAEKVGVETFSGAPCWLSEPSPLELDVEQTVEFSLSEFVESSDAIWSHRLYQVGEVTYYAFSCHHALLDGLSLRLLAERLCSALNDVPDSRPKRFLFPARMDEPLPSTSLASLLAAQLPALMSKDQGLLERRDYLTITAQELVLIRQAARSLGVPLPSLLLYSWLLILKKHISHDDGLVVSTFHHGRSSRSLNALGQYVREIPVLVNPRWENGGRIGEDIAAMSAAMKRCGNLADLDLSLLRANALQSVRIGFNYIPFTDEKAVKSDQATIVDDVSNVVPGICLMLKSRSREHLEMCLTDTTGLVLDERMLSRICRLAVRLAGLEVADASERYLLPEDKSAYYDLNHGHADSVQRDTLTDQLTSAMAQLPDAWFIRHGSVSLDRMQYSSLVQSYRDELARLKGNGGERVVICLRRGVHLAAVVHACLMESICFVPVSESLDPAVVQDTMAVAEAAYLITDMAVDDTTLDLIAELPRSVRLLRSDFGAPVMSDGLAYLIYTSGSTGVPKGVQVTRQNLCNYIHGLDKVVGLASHRVTLALTSITFDIAMTELVYAFLKGASIHVFDEQDRADPEPVISALGYYGDAFIQTTPTVWGLLLQRGLESVLSAVSLLGISGGEKLDRTLGDALLDAGVQLFNCYGPTETTVWSTLERASSQSLLQDSIGRPLPGQIALVLDPHEETLLPVNYPGRLFIGGASVSQGYTERSLTESRFLTRNWSGMHGRYYDTGDRVTLLSEAALAYLGRDDGEVKVGGVRVNLNGLVAMALSDTYVYAAKALIRNAVVNIILEVLPDYRPLLDEAWLTKLKRRLHQPNVRMIFKQIERFPSSLSGKATLEGVDIDALTPLSFNDCDVVSPQELAHPVVDTLRVLLQRDDLDIRLDLYELGGDSLTAIQLQYQLEQHEATAGRYTVQEILAAPSVLALVRSGAESTSHIVHRVDQGHAVAVVLFHSIVGHTKDYHCVIDALSGVDVFTVDLCPHAQLQSMGSIADLAQHYRAGLDSLLNRYDAVVLCGHSLGGVIALEYGRVTTAPLRRVVAIDSYLPANLADSPKPMETWAVDEAFARDFSVYTLLTGWLLEYHADRLDDQILLLSSHGGVTQDGTIVRAHSTWPKTIERLSVGGDHDTVLQRSAEEIAAVLMEAVCESPN